MAYRKATGEDAHEVKNAPVVPEHSKDIWNAWGVLTGSRNYTMGGAAAIPCSELLAYATYHRIEDDADRYRLEYLIRAMDSEMLTLHNKKD